MPTLRRYNEDDVRALLVANPDRASAAMAQNGELVKALATIFNSTVKFGSAALEKDVVGVTSALLEKGTAFTDTVAMGAPRHAATLKAGTLVSSNFIETLGMIELAKVGNQAAGAGRAMTPTGAGVFVATVTAKKVLTMAGITNQKLLSQCQVALLSMSATALTTALTAPTGIGLTLGVIALSAELVNVGLQCSADGVL